MQKDYHAEKEAKSGFTKRGLVVLIVFILLFSIMMFRVAMRTGVNDVLFNSMPSGNDAFEVAKEFIKPTLPTTDVQFAEDNFQYTKRPDSVYEVKSYYEITSNFQQVKTNYVVTLKYKGGSNLNKHNWSVIGIEKR